MLRITPDDGALPVFQVGRHLNLGDEYLDDRGQTIGFTDGSRVLVYTDRVRTRVRRFDVAGMTTAEALGLEEYLNTTLRGAVETFTLVASWGNLVPDSERFADPGGGGARWTQTGTNPPVVSTQTETGPEGIDGTADLVTFGATQSVLRANGTLPQDAVDNGGEVFVEFLARVKVPGADLSGTVNSDGGASFAWTLPGDGAWRRVRGSYLNPTQRWVDIEALSRAIVLAHVQVTLDSGGHLRFTPNRHPALPLHGTSENARFIGGTFSAVQQREDVWNVAFLVREEVGT